MLGVWTIQPSHEPLQKEKTGTFHTENIRGEKTKVRRREGGNGWMKLWGKKCCTKKSPKYVNKAETAGMGIHLQITDHRPLVLKVLFVVNVFQLHENEWALIQEIMYDTLYLKTSFLIFREKLEWLVTSEKKESRYGRHVVSFKALLWWTVQQPLFLKKVICFSITASHFGKE